MTIRYAPPPSAVDVEEAAWQVLEESRQAFHRRGPRSHRPEGDPTACSWCTALVDTGAATRLVITAPQQSRPNTSWLLCDHCARTLRLWTYEAIMTVLPVSSVSSTHDLDGAA